MIIELILTPIFYLINVVVSILGVLPDMPTEITNVADHIGNYISTGIGFAYTVFGKVLLNSVLAITVILLVQKRAWEIGKWIYRNIRG